MFFKDDDKEGSKPISHTKKERIENLREMFSSSDCSDDIDDNTESCPDESRDFGSPVSNDLSRKTEGVIVGNVICDDGECEENETEFTESTDGGESLSD